MKKYELVGEFEFFGRKFFQIKALISFGNVEAGELGGYIEKEDNLDMSGNAWVYYNAKVYGNAKVSDNARVSGNAMVYGNARVYGNAHIMWISKIGSCFRTLTIFKTEDGFKLTTGCFIGTFEQFKEAVSRKKEDDEYRKEYESLYALIELKFNKYLAP